MRIELHPLKFNPIFKEKIWGGEKLAHCLHKNIPNATTGESWEISAIKDNLSVVASGALKGKNLQELVETYKEQLVGRKTYKKFGNTFPLLIKFIDAKENLSVQLHPNDALAKERHNSFGKTEMWYIVQADENAGIITGLTEGINKQTYINHLEEKSLAEILNFNYVHSGEVFFIKPGLIHAIGKGVLLAEIQQTSDITYRVYDWDRKDHNGNQRELHTGLAIDAIDFEANNQYSIPYITKQNRPTPVMQNQYFSVNLLSISKSTSIDYSQRDSFIIYMCVEGSATLTTNGNISESISLGETVLFPACFDQVEITSKNCKLIEVST